MSDKWKYSRQQLEVMAELPDHLRRTYKALIHVGGVADATKISERTGRARAMESSYLNQLVRMKTLTVERQGRKAIFKMVELKSKR